MTVRPVATYTVDKYRKYPDKRNVRVIISDFTNRLRPVVHVHDVPVIVRTYCTTGMMTCTSQQSLSMLLGRAFRFFNCCCCCCWQHNDIMSYKVPGVYKTSISCTIVPRYSTYYITGTGTPPFAITSTSNMRARSRSTTQGRFEAVF